jgi:hypothetical protein
VLIKAEARVDRVGIAELAPVEGASGTISQGRMVAVAGGQWDEHGRSSMPFGWAAGFERLGHSADDLMGDHHGYLTRRREGEGRELHPPGLQAQWLASGA